MFETAPQFALRVLKRVPTGNHTAEHDENCAMCGTQIQAGDTVNRFSDLVGPDGFTDGRELASDTPTYICAACGSFFGGSVMDKLGNCLITEAGSFSFGKDSERSHFWLNPPKPPYVVTVAATKRQHLLWRAPITRDNRCIYIRFGARILTVQLKTVHEAVKAARTLAVLGKNKKLRHPFWLSLSRKLEMPFPTRIRPDLRRLAVEAKLHTEINLLENLSLGNYFALTSLLGEKGSRPAAPAKISIPTDSEKTATQILKLQTKIAAAEKLGNSKKVKTLNKQLAQLRAA